MATFNELLNQSVLSALDINQQLAISQQQDQLLQNSLVQVRSEIARLKSSIETQEEALNPAIELKEVLAQKKKIEQDIWVEIELRKLSKHSPSPKGNLVMRMAEETIVLK